MFACFCSDLNCPVSWLPTPRWATALPPQSCCENKHMYDWEALGLSNERDYINTWSREALLFILRYKQTVTKQL